MTPTVSILIPNRNERWAQSTVDEVLKNATGPIEVVIALDGFWPDPPITPDPRVVVVHLAEARGMRPAIDAAAAVARGTYFMKLDAHCMVGPGFDTILAAECDKDWVVVPRRYSLDAGTPEAPQWRINPEKAHRPVDAHHLCFPYRDGRDIGLHGEVWDARTKARKDILIDDEMSSQGSCWFMHRDHFFTRLGGMPLEGYGPFVSEFQQIGMKTWLGGGRCVVNKKTWYSHCHKGKTWRRGYFISQPKMILGTEWSAYNWCYNQWPKRVADFEWIIEKFSPVPTWPDNWQDLLAAKKPATPPPPCP